MLPLILGSIDRPNPPTHSDSQIACDLFVQDSLLLWHLYCYGIYQPLFDQMKKDVPNLSFHHGLPDAEHIEALSGGHALLFIDDLMQEVVNSKTMHYLFCQYCHHMGISVMFLTQNLF